MNRKLSYDGKELHEMTQEKLKEQAETNKKRIVRNNLFVATITGVSLFAFPPAALLTLGVGVVRRNWILENNKEIQKELNNK